MTDAATNIQKQRRHLRTARDSDSGTNGQRDQSVKIIVKASRKSPSAELRYRGDFTRFQVTGARPIALPCALE
jgi:hypothetical protein